MPEQTEISKVTSSVEASTEPEAKPKTLAAIDLGSNSFHMVIAHEDRGEVRPIEKRGEKVSLAAGLDEHSYLSEEAQQRGLDCLKGFATRIQGLPRSQVSILATNALREAVNRKSFIKAAEKILGHSVEVISGREEARLIYNGVAHTSPDEGGKRLVIDIGGGSTEFIIGEAFDPLALESLHMGCVSYTRRFFENSVISKSNFEQAILSAKQELQNIRSPYRKLGWSQCLGSSGTIRAIARVCQAQHQDSTEGLTYDCLINLKKALIKAGHSDRVEIPQIKSSRKPTLAGGLAILIAIFEALEIKSMKYAEGALREGALYDLIGRNTHEDIRDRTIRALQERFHIDQQQADLVKAQALRLFEETAESWKLPQLPASEWLGYAAQLHEIGLSISHSQFHKHGAYVLSVADMLGFTKHAQQMMSFLVRAHRRKFPVEDFQNLPEELQDQAFKLAVILRIAVLAHHARDEHSVPSFSVKAKPQKLELHFAEAINETLPLTYCDFLSEQAYLKSQGFTLDIHLPKAKSKKH